MVSRIKTAAKLTLVFLFVTASAMAAPIITFDQAAESGTLDYATLGGTLVGTDIGFDFITAAGTAADGLYSCSGCLLNFETGPNINPGPVLYTWGAGGSFVVTGGVPGMGIPDDSVLLTGTFSASPLNIAVGAGGFVSFLGFGVDTKHPDMLAFLGIPNDAILRFADSEISSRATIEDDGTFHAEVTEADIVNAVPVPGTSILMLLGLSGLAAYRRRQS